jgi:hypothetical protein
MNFLKIFHFSSISFSITIASLEDKKIKDCGQLMFLCLTFNEYTNYACQFRSSMYMQDSIWIPCLCLEVSPWHEAEAEAVSSGKRCNCFPLKGTVTHCYLYTLASFLFSQVITSKPSLHREKDCPWGLGPTSNSPCCGAVPRTPELTEMRCG